MDKTAKDFEDTFHKGAKEDEYLQKLPTKGLAEVSWPMGKDCA